MARRRRKGKRSGKGNRSAQPQQVHPEAAGLDVGATMVYTRRYALSAPRRGSNRSRPSPAICMLWPIG